MRIARDDVPVRVDAPGAVARQQTEFGDVSGYGKMGAEHFSFDAGTDITDLLSHTGDLFYWPPGHSVRAEADTDIVMFSPQNEHGSVIEHIRKKVNGAD